MAEKPCCRRCEYWDAGGLHLIATATVGDCLNRFSDQFNPKWDHVCPQFAEDSNNDGYLPKVSAA